MYRSKKIGVVVPAFNEERFIQATLAGMPDWIDQIIVIDDASQDNTAKIVESAMDLDSRIALIRAKNQMGPGGAIMRGYEAFESDGSFQIIAVMAGDNQMDPDDLPKLLGPICDNTAGYVKGTRFRHPNLHSIMPWSRYLGNRALSWVTSIISGYSNIEDAQCGYTAIDTGLLLPVLRDGLVSGYGLPNAILVLLGTMKVAMVQIPVKPIYRDEESGLNLITVLRVYPLLLLRSWWAKTRIAASAHANQKTGV